MVKTMSQLFCGMLKLQNGQSGMKCSHLNTSQIHFAYRAVLISGPARLPYKQPPNLVVRSKNGLFVCVTKRFNVYLEAVLAAGPLSETARLSEVNLACVYMRNFIPLAGTIL